jgi:hypothetical protein
MCEALQHRHGIIGCDLGSLHGIAIDGIQAIDVDLLEVADGSGEMIPQVVHDPLYGPAMKQVPIGIR